MKDGVKYLVGKTIAAVVVANSPRQPHNQVFLVFGDGTRFEFWGENFSCCSGLDKAEDIEGYVKGSQGKIVQVHTQPMSSPLSQAPTTGGESAAYQPALPVIPPHVPGRELKAWSAAGKAIRKARRHIGDS